MIRPAATSEILDQVPPHDLAAEAGVIGSILINVSLIDDVTAIVSADDFYREENKTIFETIVAMQNAGDPIDETVLLGKLKARDSETQWTDLLAEISGQVPIAANAKYYARIVIEKAKRRRLIHAAVRIVQGAYGSEDTVEDIACCGEAMLGDAVKGGDSITAVPMQEAVAEAMVTARERADGTKPGGLTIGLRDYDQKIGGLFPGELIVLAGRPRMGKSVLAMQIAVDVATRGQRVLVVTLEMSAGELAARVLCSKGQVNGTRFRVGKLLPADLADLDAAATELSTAKLLILDAPTVSVADIRREARRVQARHGLSLIVIDYLQLIQPENPRDPRQEQVRKWPEA